MFWSDVVKHAQLVEMLRRAKTFVKTKSLEFEDLYYDEDFEEIEEDDDGQLIEGVSYFFSLFNKSIDTR